MLDLGPETRETGKVVGASFALHRVRLGKDVRFNEKLGRRPGVLLGGEESDLLNRAIAAGFHALHVGSSVVQH